MEFPPQTYDVFKAYQFKSAQAPGGQRRHEGYAADAAQRQMPRPLHYRPTTEQC